MREGWGIDIRINLYEKSKVKVKEGKGRAHKANIRYKQNIQKTEKRKEKCLSRD